MTQGLEINDQGRNLKSAGTGGRIDTSKITPEQVLAQANKIFAPFKLEFAAPLSWFAIWQSA